MSVEVLRSSFLDELTKIAADVPARAPVRDKDLLDVQKAGKLTKGHSFGHAPEDDYTKMAWRVVGLLKKQAAGELSKKPGDVPSDEPSSSERAAGRKVTSSGGGQGTAPRADALNATKVYGPSVTLSNISHTAHQDSEYAPSTSPLDKVAAAQFDAWLETLDPMVKEAILGRVGRFLAGKPKQVLGAGGEVIGSIPMGGGGGLLGGVGKSLKESGKALRKAPKRAVGGEKFTRGQLTAAGLPADPGMAQRVGGRAVEGAGAHIQHRSVPGLLANPLGVPLGGAIEGAAKQLGVEARARGATRAGRALHRHAGKAGLVGEVAGVAGAGTALGAPVSAAGAVGGKLLAGAAPAAETALHHAGSMLHHAGHDVAGMAAQRAGQTAHRVGGRALGALRGAAA